MNARPFVGDTVGLFGFPAQVNTVAWELKNFMQVGRLIHQTFGQQRVQAAFDIYIVRPLKVSWACRLWNTVYAVIHNRLTSSSLAFSLRTTRFKIQKFYMVLAWRSVFCTDLRTHSDLCCIHARQLTGFHSRGGKCLQRGTDLVFK